MRTEEGREENGRSVRNFGQEMLAAHVVCLMPMFMEEMTLEETV